MTEDGVVRENRFVCYFGWLASKANVSRGISTCVVLVFGSEVFNLTSAVIKSLKSIYKPSRAYIYALENFLKIFRFFNILGIVTSVKVANFAS